MGYRNHLHVCQHCGVVQATASTVGPNRCVVCGERHFSEYVPANTVTCLLYSDFKRVLGEHAVEIDIDTPATVRDVLATLASTHPELEPYLTPSGSELPGNVHVVKNHEDVMAHEGLDTPVHTGDELGLFTPVGTFEKADPTASA